MKRHESNDPPRRKLHGFYDASLRLNVSLDDMPAAQEAIDMEAD